MTGRTPARPETLRGKPGIPLIGLLAVEMIIGYEWLMSGLVKIMRGDFPFGLARELSEKSEGVPAWYGGLMKGMFISNAVPFGYAIEIAELLAGVVLIVGPLICLLAWQHVSDRVRSAVLFLTAAASIGGTFLAINFHLANGASHPWLLPGDGFDEGIDLDSILPAIQIVIAWISIVLLGRLRREKADDTRVSPGAS